MSIDLNHGSEAIYGTMSAIGSIGSRTPASRARWIEGQIRLDHNQAMGDFVKNEKLLCDMIKSMGAKRGGASIGGLFFRTPIQWRCPICIRSKQEIVRLDRNGDLHCPIVNHHDHLNDCFDDGGIRFPFPASMTERQAMDKYHVSMDALVRFKSTNICGDCNTADARAKQFVGAPKSFSFSPNEMALFISDKASINFNQALSVYVATMPLFKILTQRRDQLRRDALKRWGRTP